MLAAFLAVEMVGAFFIGKVAVGPFGSELPREILLSMPRIAIAASILGYAGYRLVPRQAVGAPRALAAMCGVALGLVGGFVCYQRDVVQVSLTGRPFALHLAETTRGLAPEDIGVFMDKSPVLPFYMEVDRPLTRLKDVEELRGFLEGDRRRVVIMRRRCVDLARGAMPALFPDPPDLIQEDPSWAGGPSGDDWVAWVSNPG